MPTHDYIIANGTGAAVRADINLALSAIVSLNSSASEPGTMYAYQLWADTAAGLLKIRNGANSAWVTLRQLDGDFSIVAVEDGLQATPSLTFTNDLNTGIFRPGNDSLAIVTGATRAITITSTQAVGIQTANPSSALHVAGNARVGADDVTDAHLQIGKGASGNRNSYIDIVADTTYTDYGLRVIRNNTGANATSELKHRGTGALNFTTQEAAPIEFYTTNSPRLTILAGGNVGIGNSGPSDLLHIGNSSATTRTVFRIQTGNAYSDPNGISYANALSSIGARLAIDGTASGYIAQMGVGNSANLWLGSWNSGATDGSIQLVTGNNTTSTIRATLNSTGLGIGTTSPAYALDVASSVVQIGNSTDAFIQYKSTAGNWHVGANSSNAYVFYSGTYGTGTERARIDSSGRLLVGTSTARSNFFNSSVAYDPGIQLEGTTDKGRMASIVGSAATGAGGTLILGSQKSGAVGGNTAVTNNGELGLLSFQGNDGTEFVEAAKIEAYVDGTPGANDMPGRLVFSTTADGASSPTERMRINSSGGFKASDTGTYSSASTALHEFLQTTNTIGLFIRGTNASQTSSILEVNGDRTTTNASYNLIDAYNGNISGRFSVRDSGNAVNTNNSYGAISDIKLKENIVDANSQWDDLKALQVRNYNFKEGQTHTQIGLVAQEAELVSPGLVNESPDRDAEGNDLGTVTKSVNYSVLYMKAVKALQEAMERIEALEVKVNALESA